MKTKLVSSIDATRSRLAVVRDDILLLEVAQLLSNTQIGHRQGVACMNTAADIMTRDVPYSSATDCLPDVLSMMVAHGFVHVPKVDAHRKPYGVVNARDVLRQLWAEGPYEEALLCDYVTGIGLRRSCLRKYR